MVWSFVIPPYQNLKASKQGMILNMDGKPMRNDTPSQRTEPTSITVILYQRKICSIKNKSLHSIAMVNDSNP